MRSATGGSAPVETPRSIGGGLNSILAVPAIGRYLPSVGEPLRIQRVPPSSA